MYLVVVHRFLKPLRSELNVGCCRVFLLFIFVCGQRCVTVDGMLSPISAALVLIL